MDDADAFCLLLDGQMSDAEWEDMLERFDERSYLNARRWKPGDDPYTLYAFNQRESERIPSNRALRDTRHSRYTHTHIRTQLGAGLTCGGHLINPGSVLKHI